MDRSNLTIVRSFNEQSIPDLDVALLGALELFAEMPPPPFPTLPYTRPLVVGSEGAAVTGRMLFDDADAVFANESTYEARLAAVPGIDGAVIISASGGKHAVPTARRLKEKGIPATLFTNNPDAPAHKFLEKGSLIVFPKNREPYSYNTSTYLGMILSKTRESPADIHAFITESVLSKIPENLGAYDAFFLIVPECFDTFRSMLATKFDELFGPKVSVRVFTLEQAKHAKTIVSSESECFISFGEPQDLFGTPDRRVHIPLPDTAGFAAMMAIGYFTVGAIQKQHPPYFKNTIAEYTKKASEVFGSTIPIIVS